MHPFFSRALLESIEDSDDESLLSILQSPLMQANAPIKAHALCFATRKNKPRSVRVLVSEGADPFVKHRGRTPLYWAVRQDDADLLELLMSGCIDDISYERECQRFTDDTGQRRSSAVKFLARATRALNETCFEAASNCSPRSLEYMLSIGADPNCYFYHDDEFLSWCTPLIAACYAPVRCSSWRERVEEVVACLVKYGADVCMVNHLGDTALHWSAASGLVQSSLLLLRNGADVNKKNSLHRSVLMMAVDYARNFPDGNRPLIEMLLEWEADVHVVDWDQWNAAFYAVQSGNIEVLQLLLERGARPDIADDEVDQVVRCGCKVISKPRTSALLLAITLGHRHMVKPLLQWNADASAMYLTAGQTSPTLMSAIEEKDIGTVRMLLEAGITSAALWSVADQLEAPANEGSISKLLRHARSHPRSLKHICRLSIRSTFSSHQQLSRMADIPLPKALLAYVSFKDL